MAMALAVLRGWLCGFYTSGGLSSRPLVGMSIKLMPGPRSKVRPLDPERDLLGPPLPLAPT